MNTLVQSQLDAFFTQFPKRILSAREILLRPEETVDTIFYLTQGYVRQYVITKQGEELTLNIYKPYAFFPMAGAVGSFSRRYFFEAQEQVVVYCAPVKSVLAFMRDNPRIMLDLLSRLYSGVEGLLSRIEQLMGGSARNKLLIVLIITARRFGIVKLAGSVISPAPTHAELAEYAGLTRETVSREMEKLKKEKLLLYSSTEIVIKDLSLLEKNLNSY